MNLYILKTSDPSGNFSKEKYLIKNYQEEYDHIIKFSIENNILDVTVAGLNSENFLFSLFHLSLFIGITCA